MKCSCGVTSADSYVAEIKSVLDPAGAYALVEKLKKNPKTSPVLIEIMEQNLAAIDVDESHFAVTLYSTSNMMVGMPGIYFHHPKEWAAARIGKLVHVVMPDPSNRVAARGAPVDIHDFEEQAEEA